MAIPGGPYGEVLLKFLLPILNVSPHFAATHRDDQKKNLEKLIDSVYIMKGGV